MKSFYVKANQKSEKIEKLCHTGSSRTCIMLNVNFTQIFRKKIYIDISSESNVSFLFIYSGLEV